MRRVLRDRDPGELLESARRCNARHAESIARWERGGPFPSLRLADERHLKAALAHGGRALVCVPHCGPFFRVGFELAQHDYLMALLSDHPTYESESAAIGRFGAAYVGSHDRPAEEIVQLIDASRATAAWEMVVAIKEGRVGLVYFDADVGLDDRNGRTVVSVALAGVPVLARTGPALIAALSGATIVPAIAAFGDGDGAAEECRFHEPIANRDAEGRDAFVRRATAELYGLLERTIKADPSVWDSWFTLVSRVGTDAPTTGVLAEIPDAERVLGTPVRFDSERVEAFESPFGPLLAQIDRGSVLVRTETLDALLETVHGQTLGDLIEDLAPRFPEPAVLEAVLALASEGFLVAS